MKIIILVAGRGERLMPLTRNTPKSLIEIKDGMTLLEMQLESIKKSGVIDEIILVVGYLGEQIEAKIKLYEKNGFKIKTVLNPFYDRANNLVSLWLAKSEMNDDFLITNGDNLFSSDVFKDLVKKTQDGIVLTICKKDREEYQEDDMKVALTNKKTVVQISKLIEKEKIDAESPGLAKVSGKRYVELYKTILDQLIREKQYLDKFWLEAFNELYRQGFDVNTFEIDGKNKWREIDFHPDVQGIKKLLLDEDSIFHAEN